MSLSINVVLHQQVVFTVSHLLRQVQVARLKATFKQQCFVVFTFKPVDLLVQRRLVLDLGLHAAVVRRAGGLGLIRYQLSLPS